MKINIDEKYLPVYEALASDVRLNIIKLLSDKTLNVKEIAENLNLSSAIITMHINKLEKAGIIKSERTRSKGGVQKKCSLCVESIQIEFPSKNDEVLNYHEFNLPIGQYTNFEVVPTCGLATVNNIIGYFDDPRYFWDTDRVNAKILWFTQGFVEYKVPNFLLKSQTATELQISLELSSEAPGYNKNWPSDISFFINNYYIGKWTSPGDFGGEKGKFTPTWWQQDINQYGMLKILRINNEGSFIDGEKISDVTLDEICITEKQWNFKIAVLKDSPHVGGLTLFGSNFGNYDQDIIFRLFYKAL